MYVRCFIFQCLFICFLFVCCLLVCVFGQAFFLSINIAILYLKFGIYDFIKIVLATFFTCRHNFKVNLYIPLMNQSIGGSLNPSHNE